MPVTNRTGKTDIAGSWRESFSACTWATQNKEMCLWLRGILSSLFSGAKVYKSHLAIKKEKVFVIILADHIFGSVWWEDAHRIQGGVDDKRL